MSASSVVTNDNPDLVKQRRGMGVFPLKSLPLGFRFHPTDEELVNHYLKGKITGRIRSSDIQVIPEIDVCKCEPWDLPDKSLIQSNDPEWFFFASKDRKYPNGHRCNRATLAGYWKATGKDRFIRSRAPPGVIGMKKTLVFHCGRAPKGVRTNWIMHEYRTTEPQFDSGDQGGYVLYRLFKKLEDKTSSSDAVERSGFCQTPSKSSPGDTPQELVSSEEFATPINQDSPELDMQEDQQSLPDTVNKQPAGIERWLAEKSDCSTTSSVIPEESHCNGNTLSDVGDHEAEVGAKVDSLLNVLAQSCDPHFEWKDYDGFPAISSPMLPYTDYPFFHDIAQESHIEPYQDGNGEDDSLNEFLNTILSNQDEFPPGDSYALNDPFGEIGPDGNLSTTCVWGSDVDNKPGLAQVGAGSETSEMEPHSSNIYENTSFLPYDCAGQDVYSPDSTSESLQDLFTSMDIPSYQLNVISNNDDLGGTGIKIRTRKLQNLPNSSNLSLYQDGAIRRIRLQHRPEIESIFCEDSESNTSKDDHEEKEAVMKEEEHEENNDAERSLSSTNIGSSTSRDDGDDKEAVIEEVEHMKNNNFAGSFSCESTGCSTGKDDVEDKVAAIEEGEHVENDNADEEISGPVDLNKLQNLSITDGTTTNRKPASSDAFQESEPILRVRRKWNDVTDQRLNVSSLHQHIPRSLSTVVYSTRWVLMLIVVLLLSAGIWRSFSSHYV